MLIELFAQLFGGEGKGAGQAVCPDILEPHRLLQTPLKGRGLYRSGGATPPKGGKLPYVQLLKPGQSLRRCLPGMKTL